jgi:hypothetical protein
MTIKTHGRMFTDNTVGITQLAITDGTDGQAIVTDGSGALRFATVGAGGAVGSSVYVEDTRTGNGVLTTFSLSTAAPYEESIMVFIDGIAQPTTAYTLPTTTSITFSSAPITGTTIRICHLGIASSVADNGITGAKIAMGSDVAGDVLYYNGTDYQRLGIGTASQHLATNTAANAPEWVAPPATATTTLAGLVELATQAEVNTGTDTTRSITPATLLAFTGGGLVKQVVASSSNTQSLSSSGSWVASTGHTVSITPASTSNKVLVIVAGGQIGDNYAPSFSIFRGSTNLGNADVGFTYNRHVDSTPSLSMMALDSPSTTSSTVYQVYQRSKDGHNVGINPGATARRPNVVIVAIEIGG